MFSSTCFTLRTICSIELDTSFTLPESTDAVSFSSSPAAPSSRIELLDSSTDTLSVCELSAIPRTCWLIASIDVVVCRIPFTWSAVTDDTASDTPAISPAVASTRSAASDTRPTVARSAARHRLERARQLPQLVLRFVHLAATQVPRRQPLRLPPQRLRRPAHVLRQQPRQQRRNPRRYHQQQREDGPERGLVELEPLGGRERQQDPSVGQRPPGEDVGAPQPRAVAARFPASDGLLDAVDDLGLELRADSARRGREVDEPDLDRHRQPHAPAAAGSAGSPPASRRSRAASSIASCQRIVKSRSERVASVCASNTAKITGITVTPVTHTSSFDRSGTGMTSERRTAGSGSATASALRVGAIMQLAQQEQEGAGEEARREPGEQRPRRSRTGSSAPSAAPSRRR